MVIEIIRNLYQFNAWANKRILDTTNQISPEQLFADTNPSFGSIHNTLVHIMSAQWLWLSRWQGKFPRSHLDPKDFPDFKSLRYRWDEIERETQKFVFSRTEEDLLQNFTYRNSRDEEWAYPLWQQMVHQVNHATQHRSETAMILTEWNFSPGSMDFLFFVDKELTDGKSRRT
jgi:uncharacterized damage-inducible protein DinB